MTLEEQAVKLCEDINKYAPDILKEQIKDPWKVALLCAEGYFRAVREFESKPKSGETLLYYEWVDTNESALDCLCVAAFRAGMSHNDIVEHLSHIPQSIGDVYPYVYNKDYSLEYLNNVANGAYKEGEPVDMLLEQIKNMHYVPVTPTFELCPVTERMNLLRKGLGIGDIAVMYGIPMQDVLWGLPEVIDYMSSQKTLDMCQMVNDWICGKSIYYMGLKYRRAPRSVYRVINACGYATLKTDCTITDVNNYIKEGVSSELLTPSQYYDGTPSAHYVHVAPILSYKDMLFVKERMKAICKIGDPLAVIGVTETQALQMAEDISIERSEKLARGDSFGLRITSLPVER